MMSPARLLSTTLLAATALAPAWADDAPDLAAGQAASAVCQACHTADGSRGAPANPILQGQFPEYLAKQLHDYKSGKRQNAIMQGMAAPLTDAVIRDITAFYGSKPTPTGFARNKDSVLRGEQIWRGGIADRKIPACAGCHGPTGAGIPIQYPRLAGQHAEYTEAQLLAFRSGARASNAQMTGVAAKMNDAEIKAVADYIAGLR
jgi:cytochrome c553